MQLPLAKYTQALALLEIVHALVGLVHTSPVTAAMQVYRKERSGKHWKHCRMRREEAEGQTKYMSRDA